MFGIDAEFEARFPVMPEHSIFRSVVRFLILAILCAGASGCALIHLQDAHDGGRVSVGTPQDRVQLYVEETGHGAPLVLLHGFGLNSWTWRRLRERLNTKYRTIAIDLRGAGRSDKPFDRKYTIEDQASLVAAFIRRRGLRGVTLVGHSLGGSVALATAIQLQHRRSPAIKRMVLLNAAAYPQRLPVGLEFLRLPGVIDVTLPEAIAKGALIGAYFDPLQIDRRDVYAYARPLYESGAKHALVQTLEYLANRGSAPVAHYRRLRMPALLIWCRNDPIVPNWVGRRLQRDLPRARLVTLDRCAHVPMRNCRMKRRHSFGVSSAEAAPPRIDG